jgi:hypothetical protein
MSGIERLEPLVPVKFHTCPVCRRSICRTHGVVPLFARHSDKEGGRCPMSARPIPEQSAADVRTSPREYRRPGPRDPKGIAS